MNTPTNKLTVALEPLLPRLELDPEGMALLTGLPDAATGVTTLVEAGRLPEALRLIAHAMPKREAVWWGCMCSRAMPGPQNLAVDTAALLAAEAWVRKPEEGLRRAAMEAAQKGGFRSPEAWAAVGAFWSGGSMSPEGQPVVPPGEHLTGVAVVGAVLLAALRHSPEKADERYRRFLASAQDIAAGGAGRLDVEPPPAA
ncbi:hypothetical protein EOD42_01525 [Rhodovarius crocodyli]|uniref:Uncharacterized protein n=1 Tax=Rhodovarius crocodyli TaxID=1979269 RepID=A0A437MMD5_9PROT|nr:hypothetical protein [Rhodovarius crocodyli]RVT98818.1 hypothetical protein EOD42_01525 [Rhodovarius crocodyli]